MIGMNGGQAMVSVGVAMILQDQFTNQANHIASAYRGMMEEIYASSGASRGLTELVWSRGASAMALTTMGAMIDSYIHFADVQNDVFWATSMANHALEDQQKAISETSGNIFDAKAFYDERNEALLKRIQEVNLITPLTNQDLSSASRFMAMAGNSQKAIENMLEPVAMLSGMFGMQAGGKGGVADLFTNISMMFGRNLEDQNEAFNVANELYAVTTGANTNLQDLAQAITYSGSEMRRAGYGLRETAASIGAMGNYGIQGSSAGTALANMMRYIQLSAAGQKTKGADMLKAVGIDAKSLMDSEGHLISLHDIYMRVYEATKDLNTFDKNRFFYNVFGVRGTREIAAITQMIEDAAGGEDKYAELMRRQQEATTGNEVGSKYESWLQTDRGTIDQLIASWDNLKTTLGQDLAPVFSNIASFLGKVLNMVNWLGQSGFGGALVRAVAIGTAIQLFIRGLVMVRGLFRTINGLSATFGTSLRGAATGLAPANTQFAIMEAHLRTLVTLMAEYMAMQRMMPVGGINTAWGTMYSQSGRARVTNVGAGVRGMGVGAGLGAMTGAVVANSVARGAAAGGATAAAATRTVGSRVLGFLGGPWGIGIFTALPLIIDLLSSSSSEERRQTELLETMTPDQLRYSEEEALINALRAACKEGIIEGVGSAKPVPVEVTVDGGSTTNINLGDNDYNIFE